MRLRIDRYDDGSILSVEQVDTSAEPYKGIDSTIVEVSDEKGRDLLKRYWAALSIMSDLKDLAGRD